MARNGRIRLETNGDIGERNTKFDLQPILRRKKVRNMKQTMPPIDHHRFEPEAFGVGLVMNNLSMFGTYQSLFVGYLWTNALDLV